MTRLGWPGLTALAVLLAAPLRADIPQLLNYQGYLTDDAGAPRNGVQALTFSIHDAAEGGAQLWTETQNVMVADGLFNVLLGTVTLIPIGVFQGDEQYLAVRVGGGPELAPRTRLVSVGHCFKAREAERLDGRAASAYARSVDGVPPQNGNVDLVAGANVTITPNTQAGSVTIASSALTLPFSSSIESSQSGLTVRNTGSGVGILASSTSSYGLSASSSTSYGVRASSSGETGYGVYGLANGDNARGIVGSTTGANGYGVWGSSQKHHGVHGSSTTGIGVYGTQSHSGNVGLLASEGYGAYGEHDASGNFGALGSAAFGVDGVSRAGTGVHGQHLGSANYGLLGSALQGVYGEHDASGNFGALGRSAFGAYGQYGPDADANSGFLGGSEAGAGGRSESGYGVFGDSGSSDGVRGHSDQGYGVRGISDRNSSSFAGVVGIGTRAAAGVLGSSVGGRGVHGFSDGGTAVYAEGDLEVTGAFTGDIDSASGSDGAPFPRPAFDSGWVSIAAAAARTFEHEIGGDADDYVVDLQFRHDGSLGIHQRGYGLYEQSATLSRGAYWYALTNQQVRVYRAKDDTAVDAVRLRIWVVR